MLIQIKKVKMNRRKKVKRKGGGVHLPLSLCIYQCQLGETGLMRKGEISTREIVLLSKERILFFEYR